MSVRRVTSPIVALALAGALLLLGVADHGMDSGLLALSPALALLIPLVAGRYVGSERLERLAARRRPIRRRPPAPLRLTPRAPRVATLRGRLLAGTRADRGPPAALAARA